MILNSCAELDDLGSGRFRNSINLRPIAYLSGGSFQRIVDRWVDGDAQLGHMLPGFVFNDAPYSRYVDIAVFCQLFQRVFSGSIQLTNLACQFVCEFCQMALSPLKVRWGNKVSSSNSILNIIRICAWVNMCWVATGTVIALMTRKQVFRYGAVCKFIGHAMGLLVFKASVSLTCPSQPGPAFIGATNIYLAPKSLYPRWMETMTWHEAHGFIFKHVDFFDCAFGYCSFPTAATLTIAVRDFLSRGIRGMIHGINAFLCKVLVTQRDAINIAAALYSPNYTTLKGVVQA